jgi:hypothetical protein
MKARCIVRLGAAEWARHTRPSSVVESLRLLGSVQRGAQVGALAVDDNGTYFQVNGVYVAPLSKRVVAKAVTAAQGRSARSEPPRPQSGSTAVVTVRRRRVVVSPTQIVADTSAGD